ncbi:chromosome partitioning protein [Algoriphagus aquaeductus]|uniref:Chromosome partitioning protein n=1 Tax=Algoriphagus aquaeductus TaxID=475299 RepID=A0A326S6U5_9BACT|nr:ParA family protein [Algoriphagus aquaeductus]PZV87232.1 chromosome partitioning protein [Algoriphagus aquaeductus]
MKTISIMNHKGGTGKTTSSINIGAGLAKKGLKVLLLDIDSQANLTEGLGKGDPELSVYDSIRENKKLPILNVSENLDLVPSSIDLLGAEMEIVSKIGREQILHKLLKPIRSEYDYIIIDCPPSVGLLTVNAMVASDTILLPLQGEYFAYKGVDRLLGIVNEVRDNLNDKLEIGGVFITQINPNRILTKTIVEKLTEDLQDKVFDTKIRINVALAEAQLQGQTIFDYAPESNGAKDYEMLVEEILNRLN